MTRSSSGSGFWSARRKFGLAMVVFYVLALVDLMTEGAVMPIEVSYFGDPTTLPGVFVLALLTLPFVGIAFVVWLLALILDTISSRLTSSTRAETTNSFMREEIDDSIP